jgi:hypothetical protein
MKASQSKAVFTTCPLREALLEIKEMIFGEPNFFDLPTFLLRSKMDSQITLK